MCTFNIILVMFLFLIMVFNFRILRLVSIKSILTIVLSRLTTMVIKYLGVRYLGLTVATLIYILVSVPISGVWLIIMSATSALGFIIVVTGIIASSTYNEMVLMNYQNQLLSDVLMRINIVNSNNMGKLTFILLCIVGIITIVGIIYQVLAVDKNRFPNTYGFFVVLNKLSIIINLQYCKLINKKIIMKKHETEPE